MTRQGPADAALVAAALRVNARYVEEVVIGWGLCPWAARAWTEGQVTQRVFTDAEPDVESVAAFVDELCAKPDAAIGLATSSSTNAATGWTSGSASVNTRCVT